MHQGGQETIQQLANSIATKRHLRKIRAYYHEVDLIGAKKAQPQHQNEVEELEQSDMLKTLCHQKRVLTHSRWKQLKAIHQKAPCGQEDYKHFLMIVSQANYRKLQHPGYYRQLLKQTPNYPQIFFSAIEKDIPRTLPDTHPFQSALRNILYCYAVRNPSLLYCQGMNYIVAFLLINGFSEEEGFWFLIQVIEDIVMPDYFKDLSTISVTVQIFEDVIKHVFPDFAAEMEEVGMESGIFLVTWYICLFTKGFINSVSQYLLEMLILESRQYPIGFILIKISLGILATLFTRDQRFEFEKDFKSLKESIENNVYDIALEELKKGLQYFDFNFPFYSKLNKFYMEKRQKNFGKALEKQLRQKKLSLPTCNKDDPVCLHRIEMEKKIGCIEQVLILKNKLPVQNQLIDDYFPKKVQRGPPVINYSSPEECPITHHRHICFAKQLQSLKPKKLRQQQSMYLPVQELETSAEMASKFEKVQDLYNQLSNYFIVHQQEVEELDENQQMQQLQVLDKGQQKHSQKNMDPATKQKNNFVSSFGNAFKKAIDSIKLLRTNHHEEISH